MLNIISKTINKQLLINALRAFPDNMVNIIFQKDSNIITIQTKNNSFTMQSIK